MLTPAQKKEWAKQVEHVQPYVGHRTAGMWAGTIVAVDLELAALRTALTTARGALARYANPRIVADYTGDEWERVTSPDTARQAVAAIDLALGKEEAQG